MKPIRPEDVFRAEKERASSARNSQHARLLAEAKAAFDKLMAEGQAARKSGRPRKHPLPPLKTTSSRPPLKPAEVAAPVFKASVPPAVVARPVKPARTAATKKAAKPARPAKPGRPAKTAKTAKGKPKAKPSKKR